MAVEAKRGCGYRRCGGLYLVGGGLSAPCDRMPYPLERCPTCGGGVKFTRGHTWLAPDFFPTHETTWRDGHSGVCGCERCPICGTLPDPAAMLLLWIGRAHYSPESFLDESRRLGVSRRITAPPKGLVVGKTWVLLAHLDAVPAKECPICGPACNCETRSKPTPGIFSAFIPRAVELILKQSDATDERRAKEEKRGVTIVTVPDDDKDHQGSVWDKDDEQEELPGVSP